MPSEREELWVDEMDGPERHERAKKRRAEQLKRWERRENTTSDEDVKRRRTNEKVLKFVPNVVILEAAARNDLDEVARLLENGVSPDLSNEDGLTALHQSCIDGCDDMVKYLIEHNANVNACDKESWTPLHAASACNHISIIQYLCENGGNILALNLDGNFPVDLIESNDEVEKYLEQQLSKLGYDDEAIEELRQNQGKQLLDDLKNSVKNGRNLDIQDDDGATAFHVAAAQGWTSVVNYLLENEADFEIRDDDGWQPIHAAATWGHDDVLELLVASGADLDARTNNAETPLDLTEEDEIIELIEELKTKVVNYPRKGKGVRRKRSNTNTSIKRSSIHEKNELSHADTKAEGAALFIQLQNTENLATSSPDEPAVQSPSRVLESPLSEQTSISSREETSSSGYHSEGSTKSEEKTELSQPGKTTDTTKEKAVRNSGDHNDKVEKEQLVPDKKEVAVKEEKKEEKSSTASDNTITNIKQSPVPKPPRLMREPKPYINLEIGPLETAKDVSTPVKSPEHEAKKNTGSENVEPKNSTNKTELNKLPETRARVHGGQTTSSERRTTPLLPKLASSDKRRAPEPPDAPTNAATRKQSPATAPRHDSATRKKIADQEVPTAQPKKAALSSSPPPPSSSPPPPPPPPHRNTAVTNTSPEEKDREQPLAKKTGARGFTFPRARKTCCSVM